MTDIMTDPMAEYYKANIILTFEKSDGKGGHKQVRVTLSKVRKSLTTQEVREVGETFRSLVKHPLVDVEFVQSTRIN